ncbi:hypothetical protein ACFWPX_31525 [Nocardia sp. NPDC058518]|uniref:hypothetical protein n=1 Tax=Nocardia sp. NPDC058518 TaxID=3346534 RepID=UPI00365C487C
MCFRSWPLGRRLCWDRLPRLQERRHPEELSARIEAFLSAGGARTWQRTLAVPALTKALTPADA